MRKSKATSFRNLKRMKSYLENIEPREDLIAEKSIMLTMTNDMCGTNYNTLSGLGKMPFLYAGLHPAFRYAAPSGLSRMVTNLSNR